MKNLKKVFSLFVALAFILSSMSVAFASSTAPAAGIEDEDVKEAVERLAVLGIVDGKEDGKFHEEDNLTRDEFAKMLVVALGLENSAKASMGTTRFSDVPASRWSSGYINVAASKGLVKGRPDGTFAPLEPVTYSEAITMLVRALGYKDEWLDGTWPANMVNKADEIGILDGVTISANACTRGDAAILLNNTLDKDMVVQTGFGDEATFEVQEGRTILNSKLDVNEISGIVTEVPKINDNLDADELIIWVDEDEDGTVDSGEEATYKVVLEDVDANSFFGKEVTALVNDDDEAILVSIDTAEDDIVVGTITAIDGSTYTIKEADGSDADYDLASGADIYVDNTTDTLALGQYGTFILNSDNEIGFADVYAWDKNALYVSDIDVDDEFFKGYPASSGNKTKVDLTDKDGYKFFGDVSSLDELEEGDIAYVTEVPDNGDEYFYVFVVRNVVTGTLERTNGDATEVRIDGEDYDSDTSFATVSTDDDEEIVDLDSASLLENAIDTDVTAYLDLKGEIRHIVTDAEATSDVIYGVILNVFTNNEGDEVIKVYVPETDSTATYVYDKGVLTDLGDNDVGAVVAFTVDSDNEVDKFTSFTTSVNNADPINSIDSSLNMDNGIVTELNEDYDYTVINNRKTYVYNDTVIVNADVTSADDATVIDWADIEGKTPDPSLTAYVVYDGSTAKFIAFTAGYNLSSDYVLAVAVDRYYDGKQKAEMDIYDQEENDILVLDGVNFDEGDVVVYQTDGDGEINGVAIAVSEAVYATTATDMEISGVDTQYDVIAATVDSFSNSIIEFTTISTTGPTDTSYKLTDSVEVYNLILSDGAYDSIEVGDLGDIGEGDDVRIITNSDGEPEMVVIIED